MYPGVMPAKEEFHVAEQIDQESAEKVHHAAAAIGMPVDRRIPGPDDTGLEPLLRRSGMGPVRESNRNAKDVVDICGAGGILESRPEAETIVVELPIADAQHHIASDHHFFGHGNIQPDLQADVPRLGESLPAQAQQHTNKNQFRFHKRLPALQETYLPLCNPRE